MKTRGTQKKIKPVEVNVDTVYVRTNIENINNDEFEGLEYDESTYSLQEYIEKLSKSEDLASISTLVSSLISEIDFLKSRIKILETNRKGGK